MVLVGGTSNDLSPDSWVQKRRAKRWQPARRTRPAQIFIYKIVIPTGRAKSSVSAASPSISWLRFCSLPGIRSFSNRILSTECHSCANILSLAAAAQDNGNFFAFISAPFGFSRSSASALDPQPIEPAFVWLWNYFESGNWFSFLIVHGFSCCLCFGWFPPTRRHNSLYI